ncbi:Lrp/AsnC family transcriptional regulator [Aureimonas flava]|uniref:Lrp/AsnC family transcriptional regulator n=1 Tax=Aureimonas flava TaxID=2320271 RepID=A0A3A1WM52_9HYPH|nr:Lrp/AsnC family transcriptional regulator [Aureimonas flava]RIY02637.1 Lrp/AsnC family transcriptional regulator [Aureimonas flava]
MLQLDATDIRILAEIQREGRIAKTALAERVGLSATPCWMRLKRLEKAGIVAGYHARIDWRLAAPVTTVIVEVTLGGHRQADFDRFERAMRAAPEVVSCWSTGGGVDYVVKVAARDVEAYQSLVDGWLDREIGILRYVTYVVTKVVKDAIDPPASLFAAP